MTDLHRLIDRGDLDALAGRTAELVALVHHLRAQIAASESKLERLTATLDMHRDLNVRARRELARAKASASDDWKADKPISLRDRVRLMLDSVFAPMTVEDIHRQLGNVSKEAVAGVLSTLALREEVARELVPRSGPGRKMVYAYTTASSLSDRVNVLRAIDAEPGSFASDIAADLGLDSVSGTVTHLRALGLLSPDDRLGLTITDEGRAMLAYWGSL